MVNDKLHAASLCLFALVAKYKENITLYLIKRRSAGCPCLLLTASGFNPAKGFAKRGVICAAVHAFVLSLRKLGIELRYHALQSFISGCLLLCGRNLMTKKTFLS